MKLVILGSGGAISTPRPFCMCDVCKKARKLGEPYKRNSSSLYIRDINTVIDCGEDIADSLNRRNIKNVKNLFITHWHPDHTFGLRKLLESNYNFRKEKAQRVINLFIPKRVYSDIIKKYPIIKYLIYSQGLAKLHLIKDKQIIRYKGISIQAIKYSKTYLGHFAYKISGNNKKVLYSPCDTANFSWDIINLDLMITENGVFEKHKTEITFEKLIKKLDIVKPKKTILTHIEEVDIKLRGWDYLNKMKNKYLDLHIDFAFDGMEINV